MALAATDLKFYISGGSVGAGNTDPANSLGGVITSTEVGTGLFDNISSAEAAAGEDEYRAFFVKNTSATDTAYNVKFWNFDQYALIRNRNAGCGVRRRGLGHHRNHRE